MQEDYDALVAKYDYETKLDIAAWVISKIDEHGTSPGSFRYLIYERLGFGPDAYVPLYSAGGMNITNELDYDSKEPIIEVIKRDKIDNKDLKLSVGLCDEPGCFERFTCGWPSEGGYRNTCYNHSKLNNDK